MRSDDQKKNDAEKIRAEVEDRMAKQGIPYADAYQQVKNLPDFRPIFEAMEADHKSRLKAPPPPVGETTANAVQQRRAAMQVAVNGQMEATGCTYDEAWKLIKNLPQFQGREEKALSR